MNGTKQCTFCDYDKETERLAVNSKEGKVVKTIFKKYIKFQSLGLVRRYLIKRRIPTRSGNGWCDTTVGAILGRRVYLGLIENGEGEVECPEIKIIDEEAFKEAQEIRESRRGLSPRLRIREHETYSEGFF